MRPVLIALLTCLPAAAAAQDSAFCGGISTVGTWVGDDPDGSDVTSLSAPAVLDAAVPIAGHAVTLFTLSDPVALRVDVDGMPEGDPHASIFDEGGRMVASDDDGGEGLGVRMEVTLDAGTYCLATRSYDLRVTDVIVRMGPASTFGAPPDASGPAPDARGACGTPDVARLGGGPLDAASLAGGLTAMEAAVARPGYAFTLSEPTGVTVTAVSPDDDADPLVRLLDGDGTVIVENDDADGLNSRIEVNAPLEPGEYCIAVEDLDERNGRIAVTLSPHDPGARRRRDIDAMEVAPLASDGVDIEEMGTLEGQNVKRVEAGQAARWIGFTVREGGLLVIEAVSPDGSADPTVRLFDGAGRSLGWNDDGPVGLDSLLVHRAGPGRYLLGVSAYEDAKGPVNVLVERYLPAD